MGTTETRLPRTLGVGPAVRPGRTGLHDWLGYRTVAAGGLGG